MPNYKFFCFNGQVRMVYGINGRMFGNTVELGVYTPDFQITDVVRNDERAPKRALPKP